MNTDEAIDCPTGECSTCELFDLCEYGGKGIMDHGPAYDITDCDDD